MKRLAALLAVTASLGLMAARSQAPATVPNGLALTPPMGWNSWNHFGCRVDETVIRGAADAMVASGMRDVGYQYVIIDDCWQGERDELGFIRPDPKRFPSGMKALADYVHGKGLKLGIYSDAGAKTCGGRAGSRGREFQDARTYAEWGIDYLKYDWCNTEGLNAAAAYTTMRDAIRAAGRPIVLGICEWGENQPWTWGPAVGHLWRTTGDITACFDCVVDHGTWKSWGILQIADKQDGLRAHAGPDRWNDPDMLEVGNGMSAAEDRAHFSLWSMLAAPLIAGNDLASMRAETAAILTNRDVVAVDQDRLGVQGFRFRSEGGLETWVRPLADGAWTILFLNRADAQRTARIDWSEFRVQDDLSKRTLEAGDRTWLLRDLWKRQAAGDTTRPFSAAVAPHDVVMLRLTPRRQPATQPAMKTWQKERFEQRHRENLARGAAGPIGALFLGDSITEGWNWGGNREIFDRSFGAMAPANFGIGGDQTQHVLWRIENGELDGIEPRVVVLLIGVNNIDYPAEEIRDGVLAVVTRVREMLPSSRLLLMAIFPTGADPADPVVADKRRKIAFVNETLAALDDGDRVRYLDLGPRLMAADGKLPPAILPDALHLSAAGYRIWADAMLPLLEEMMK